MRPTGFWRDFSVQLSQEVGYNNIVSLLLLQSVLTMKKRHSSIIRMNRGAFVRALVVFFLDILCLSASIFVSLWVRFDFSINRIPQQYQNAGLFFLPIWFVSCFLVYLIFQLYNSVWRFVGTSEAVRITCAYIVLLPILVLELLLLKNPLPRSCAAMLFVLSFISCAAVRFSYRFFRKIWHDTRENGNAEANVMLVGAGAAARALIHENEISSHLNGRICCLVDDNPSKLGRSIEGIRIEGNRYDIPALVDQYQIQTIIYAIPAAKPEDKKEILNICKETGCHLRMIPGIYQLVNGEVTISQIRDVDITDLLGRPEVHVNNSEILQFICGQTVLVTGGGGSIGSELCRQIAGAGPKRLIIFDIYENNAYAIQQELHHAFPQLAVETLIGSVRNTNRVNSVLAAYRPDIIYHAAAHKHVPLMEDSPNEAIKNNVMGTYKLAEAAAHYGVKKFLLISTDKAVNPTNVMGASKRVCEMIVQMENRRYPDTDYMAVRFGNVLGSNGSVIPLFKKQIAEGGPVTVTDPNIIRYFMTIPEAVSLVLQASYYARGGEIFILDMGEPVRIDDLARNLIKLSGFVPDVDIPIVYTGLRPGEKLYEELLMDEEGMQSTENSKIFIGHPIRFSDEEFLCQLKELDQASRNEVSDIRSLLTRVVPTYHPKERDVKSSAS